MAIYQVKLDNTETEKVTYSSWCECCNHYTAKNELIDNWCYYCTERH